MISPADAPTLAPHHQAMLSASAITPAVIAARGYQTVSTKVQLARLGFATAQQLSPALVIPVYNVRGELSTYVLRPDVPRIRKGKPAKYEFMRGFHMVLDVPNLAPLRAQLDDPNVPLWLTEGSKKIDALASLGCCGVSVIGVWNWRGTNAKGGKTALADWELIALNNRTVYIAYDSDVMTKAEVYGGLCRLAEFLALRQAHVRYVYLPAAASGGKQGIDDYLADGHSLAEVLALATAQRQAPPDKAQASDRPVIAIGSDITPVVDAMQAALVRLPEVSQLFQRARRLTRITHGLPTLKWLTRASDAPVISAVDAAHLRELAARAAPGLSPS